MMKLTMLALALWAGAALGQVSWNECGFMGICGFSDDPPLAAHGDKCCNNDNCCSANAEAYCHEDQGACIDGTCIYYGLADTGCPCAGDLFCGNEDEYCVREEIAPEYDQGYMQEFLGLCNVSPERAIGEWCYETADCDSGLRCYNNACEDWEDRCEIEQDCMLGHACSDHYDCMWGIYYCDANVCVDEDDYYPLADGESCSYDDECENLCVYSSCGNPLADGESCWYDDDCQNVCLWNTCGPLQADGEDCWEDEDCEGFCDYQSDLCYSIEAEGDACDVFSWDDCEDALGEEYECRTDRGTCQLIEVAVGGDCLHEDQCMGAASCYFTDDSGIGECVSLGFPGDDCTAFPDNEFTTGSLCFAGSCNADTLLCEALLDTEGDACTADEYGGSADCGDWMTESAMLCIDGICTAILSVADDDSCNFETSYWGDSYNFMDVNQVACENLFDDGFCLPTDTTACSTMDTESDCLAETGCSWDLDNAVCLHFRCSSTLNALNEPCYHDGMCASDWCYDGECRDYGSLISGESCDDSDMCESGMCRWNTVASEWQCTTSIAVDDDFECLISWDCDGDLLCHEYSCQTAAAMLDAESCCDDWECAPYNFGHAHLIGLDRGDDMDFSAHCDAGTCVVGPRDNGFCDAVWTTMEWVGGFDELDTSDDSQMELITQIYCCAFCSDIMAVGGMEHNGQLGLLDLNCDPTMMEITFLDEECPAEYLNTTIGTLTGCAAYIDPDTALTVDDIPADLEGDMCNLLDCHNGDCVDGECVCEEGYVGSLCEYEAEDLEGMGIDICDITDCGNGSCDTDGSCVCDAGWVGHNCMSVAPATMTPTAAPTTLAPTAAPTPEPTPAPVKGSADRVSVGLASLIVAVMTVALL